MKRLKRKKIRFWESRREITLRWIAWLSLFFHTATSVAFGMDPMETFQKSAREIVSIETNFTQEKHLPMLVQPLVSTGRFHFRAPDALRWEYAAPVKSVLIFFKGKSQRFLQSETGALESAGADAPFMEVVLQEISNWMTGRFDENPMFALSPGNGNTMVLTPKTEAMAHMISKIELIPSPKIGVLSEVVIFESPESFTRISFMDPVINHPIADVVFTQIP